MNFIDLAAQQRLIVEKLNANIAKVLAHGQYINGPEVRELENALAVYIGVRHAVGCASGTDALLMALMALDIGPGDAVFTTPFTFIATAEVISLLGAMPVFVDIDPVTFNIDPQQLEKAIIALKSNDPSSHPLPLNSVLSTQSSALIPKGVIPVDLFGFPVDMPGLRAALPGHVVVVEDAAKSLVAACVVGRPKFLTPCQAKEILSLPAVKHRTKMAEAGG